MFLVFQVLISRNGVLQQENLPNTVTESFWIGPSLVSFENEKNFNFDIGVVHGVVQINYCSCWDRLNQVQRFLVNL